MTTGSYNIGAMFNMNKTKFDILNVELLPKIDKSVDEAHIFINLDSVYKYLIIADVERYMMQVYDEEDLQYMLISNTINLAQHYRLYFTKLGIRNKVFLYWNNLPTGKAYSNTEHIKDYRKTFDDLVGLSGSMPFIRDILAKVLKTTSTIIRYVNEVYMILTDTIESSVVPYVIYQDQDPDKKYQNFIVTEDIYDYQYVNYGFTMINPITKNNDQIVITENNIMERLAKKYRVASIKTLPKAYLVPLLLTKGNNRRGIPKIDGLTPGVLVTAIHEGIESLVITENTTYIGTVSLVIPEQHRTVFTAHFNAMDIPTQYAKLSATDRFHIFSQIIDKFDDISLYDLNDRFFKNHLLMIIDPISDQTIFKSDYS